MGISTLESGAVAARLHMTPPTQYLGLVILDSGGPVADEGSISLLCLQRTRDVRLRVDMIKLYFRSCLFA
jgi:hypothetical protein